jgi:hypothetical protein
MVVLNHLAMDCSLLLATLQNRRTGIKLIFSTKIEVTDAGYGLN